MKTDVSEFLGFSAGVFGVPVGSLTLETSYGHIPAWDSMAQLRLVMEIAARYGVEIPFADVPNVKSLWEFCRRINGGSVKKAVAVDLDGTLWEGVVGEDGVAGIRPKTAFLAELKALKERGVLLVALSKNNPQDGLDGLESLPVLRPEDFVALRIDWGAKADNLRAVARELNIGTDSFVFVDDNPVERLEMGVRLPEVSVAEFPPNLAAYFPERALTAEDLVKTEQYRAEAKRRTCLDGLEETRKGPLDADEIWEALGCRLDVHVLEEGEIPRVSQLSQKANQFNVRTNRRSEAEIRGLAAEGTVVTFRAGDRFGDQGLVGYVIERGGELLDWVMSCRVMGRGIEDRVERIVEELLAAKGVTTLRAAWVRSGRNEPVKDLFDRLGFRRTKETEDERLYERVLG